MIEEPRVLQEEFIPHEVEHRHEEVNRLSTTLEPCLDGESPENAFLFGPTGTGKTCIAKFTLNRLKEEAPEVATRYVNCWQDYNRFRVIYRLLEGIGQAADIRRQSTPKDELLERLREADDRQYLVILDEVDQLAETKVLYDLYAIPHVTMIPIANREANLFAHLDDRVRSRLKGAVRIQFDKYTVDELVSIFESRVEWGLRPGVVSREELELIADLAAGDARVGIGILRAAARHAERESREKITAEVIKEALPDARDEIDEKTLEKLNDHQRILYDIIEEHDEVQPETLYAAYDDRADDPRSDRTLRNYLSKMERYDLIRSEGETRDRVYRLATHP